ncbi:hypothetical protein AKO1_008913 [Acrasis kona]|uniref:RGS domain-containing protein n=1 Tax=Acrasis kona TaxID=1008807 RepID=A0AAW2ZFL6_9EUKA
MALEVTESYFVLGNLCYILAKNNYTLTTDYTLAVISTSAVANTNIAIFQLLSGSATPIQQKINSLSRDPNFIGSTQASQRFLGLLINGNITEASQQFPLSRLSEMNNIITTGFNQLENIAVDYFNTLHKNNYSTGIGYLVPVLSSEFIFVILIILSMVLFSQTITGPWERLNILQEDTIRKFVPKGFLSLIKCDKISDVRLGKCQERGIVMMLVEVSEFGSTAVSGGDSLVILNKFLQHVCPVVRRYSGFVNKYHHDGFSAIFRSKKMSVKACLEIKKVSETFHQVNTGFDQITVNIAIHSACVTIGAVGENERMDGVIMSDQVKLNHHLMSINEKLSCNLITTSTIVPNTDSNFVRVLSKIDDPYGNKIKIMELFEPTESKAETRKIFNEASKLFRKKFFYDALDSFDNCLKYDVKDTVCKRYISACRAFIVKSEILLAGLDTKVALSKPTLRALIEEQCEKEFSTENAELYKLSEEFLTINDEDQRRIKAELIYDMYVKPDAERAVNITSSTIQNVRRRLDDPMRPVGTDLFDEIMNQMIVNLSDTLNRVKNNIEFKKELMKINSESFEQFIY